MPKIILIFAADSIQYLRVTHTHTHTHTHAHS